MDKIEVVADIHMLENVDTRKSNKQKDSNVNKDDKNTNNHQLPTSVTPTGPILNTNNERKICLFYENRKCKFGEQCRNHHPEACPQVLEYGKCTKD